MPDLLAHIQEVPHVHGDAAEELIIVAAAVAAIWIAVRIYLSRLAQRGR
jgi:hypothetical protein